MKKIFYCRECGIEGQYFTRREDNTFNNVIVECDTDGETKHIEVESFPMEDYDSIFKTKHKCCNCDSEAIVFEIPDEDYKFFIFFLNNILMQDRSIEALFLEVENNEFLLNNKVNKYTGAFISELYGGYTISECVKFYIDSHYTKCPFYPEKNTLITINENCISVLRDDQGNTPPANEIINEIKKMTDAGMRISEIKNEKNLEIFFEEIDNTLLIE